jgi:hypothetical protein
VSRATSQCPGTRVVDAQHRGTIRRVLADVVASFGRLPRQIPVAECNLVVGVVSDEVIPPHLLIVGCFLGEHRRYADVEVGSLIVAGIHE